MPWVQGVSPPYFNPQLAVGFSESSASSQVTAVNANGRTAQYLIGFAAVPILSDSIPGTATFLLLGGAPCWIGYSANVDQTNGYRLIPNEEFTIQPVIPTWAIGAKKLIASDAPGIYQNPIESEIPPTLIQVSIVEMT